MLLKRRCLSPIVWYSDVDWNNFGLFNHQLGLQANQYERKQLLKKERLNRAYLSPTPELPSIRWISSIL